MHGEEVDSSGKIQGRKPKNGSVVDRNSDERGAMVLLRAQNGARMIKYSLTQVDHTQLRWISFCFALRDIGQLV